ncbi:hypothetical protein GTY67_02375 [Streptomyces sp. SID8374]|uniref:hypothetical protein n=1 Tax=Streptomyces sp. SID8374 TaxID=2690354 RepID=UPI0013721628|nr:hypothetical protein [Streptomyces sp. SID8374]MYX12275.1 hypothetical protein [Streptomyces sp. SID8374]
MTASETTRRAEAVRKGAASAGCRVAGMSWSSMNAGTSAPIPARAVAATSVMMASITRVAVHPLPSARGGWEADRMAVTTFDGSGA